MMASEIRIPREFSTFSNYCEDETADFSASQEDLIRQAVEDIGDQSRILILRDFLNQILSSLSEAELSKLWLATSPPVAFEGGRAYTQFFTQARDLMTEKLERRG